MRRYILNTVGFLFLLGGLLFLLELLTSFVVSNNSKVQLQPNVRYIVVGPSNPECAFNDSLIENFKNLSQSGESYFYTYFKLLEILKHNSQIEMVFIEFHKGLIMETMNDWVWKNNTISYRYPKYSALMKGSEHVLLLQQNSGDFINAYSMSLKERFRSILKNDYTYYTTDLGGYLPLSKSMPVKENVRDVKSNDLQVKPTHEMGVSEVNLLYLEKIIQLCKEYKKRVLLISSPVYNDASQTSCVNADKWVPSNVLKDVSLLDFTSFCLDRIDFADGVHLNYSGANKFSLWFNKLLIESVDERGLKKDILIQRIKEAQCRPE